MKESVKNSMKRAHDESHRVPKGDRPQALQTTIGLVRNQSWNFKSGCLFYREGNM